MNLKIGGVELLNSFPLNSSHEQIIKGQNSKLVIKLLCLNLYVTLLFLSLSKKE